MENKEAEVIIEQEDKGYSDLLDKFETPQTVSKKKNKRSAGFLALIISLICAAALGGVLCFLLFAPQSGDISANESDSGNIKTGVNDNKEWQADVKVDKKGNIKNNGSGDFLEKVPSDIKKIELENSGGKLTITSYTPKTKTTETDPETGEAVEKTDTTEYTVVGFEDLELQSGVADEIANACTNLTFESISDKDATDHLSDYGLDKPKAVAKVYFSDDTTATFKVGNNAPQNLGTYVLFGSKNTVYLCDKETVENLLLTITDLASLTINSSADDADNSSFTSVKLNDITIKPSKFTDQIQNTYTLDDGSFADENEASQIAGAIRGLYAESVAAVNPTADQLKKFGLTSPKAHIIAKYPDTTVDLIASKPNSSGVCHLMETDGKLVYTISSASIPWVSTTREKLTSRYLLNVKLSGLKGLSATANNGTYDFKIKTTVTKTTDDEGEESESTNTVTKYKNTEIDEGCFETFLNNLSLLKFDSSNKKPSGSPALTVKYTYAKNRSADTIRFYKNGSDYLATINNTPVGTVYRSYIEKLRTQPARVAVDKEVKSFW